MHEDNKDKEGVREVPDGPLSGWFLSKQQQSFLESCLPDKPEDEAAPTSSGEKK